MSEKNLLITIDFPPEKGGISTYLEHLCEYIPNIVVLAQSHENSRFFDRLKSYSIIRKNFFPAWYRLFLYLPQILKKEKVKKIHISHILPLGYVAFVIKKIFGIRYLLYLHGYDLQLALRNRWKRWLTEKIILNADRVIANSLWTKDRILKFMPDIEEKLTICHPCPSNFLLKYPINIEIIEKYKGHIVLLTVGRLVGRKGHSIVLESLQKIIKEFPTVRYLIIGSGPEETSLKKFVHDFGLSDYVEFLGEIDHSLLPSYYTLSTLFVMPNKMIDEDVEGFGMVFLEANLFKKPVIGGDSGGVSEAIVDKKSGFLIHNNNVEMFVERVLSALKNPEITCKMGEYGYDRVIKEFTWEKQIKNSGILD